MINKDLLKNLSAHSGIELSEKALDRFDIYAAALVEENNKYNLTSITEPDEIVIKHFTDSLELLKYFDFNENTRLLDVGSGAGFPAIPLLIARDGGFDLTLLDSRLKRTEFMSGALAECSLSAETVCARAEELGKEAEYREQYDAVTARAVAPLNALSELCLPFVKVGGSFLAMKGANDETEESENAVKQLGGEIERVVSYKLSNGDARSIVIVKKISQTPTEYPRKYKKIQTRPL